MFYSRSSLKAISLIDGKTYRQINLNLPTFPKTKGVSLLRYERPQGVNMLRNTIRWKILRGQHPPLWHAHTMRMGIRLINQGWLYTLTTSAKSSWLTLI